MKRRMLILFLKGADVIKINSFFPPYYEKYDTKELYVGA